MKKEGEAKKLRRFILTLMIGLAATLVLIFFFQSIAVNFLTPPVASFDQAVGQWFIAARNSVLTYCFTFFTYVGSAYIEIPVLLLCIGYFYKIKRHFWESLILTLNLTVGHIINEFLKSNYHRIRPDYTWLTAADGYSFPSGHAMIALGFYGMLGYLLFLNTPPEKKNLKNTIAVVTILLINLIGFSRVYLGVHYVSDVVGGFLAGGVWLISCMIGLVMIRFYRGRSQLDD